MLLQVQLTSVGELQAFLGRVIADYQLRTWNPDQKFSLTEATTVKLNLALKECVSEGVIIAVGLDVRRVDFVRGETVLGLIDRVFPYHLCPLVKVVWHCRAQCVVMVTEEVMRGAIYQVWFRAGQYLVQPFGFLWLDPFTRLTEVQKLCEFRYYHGKTAVTIRANNQVLRNDGPVCCANELGVLRASVFPLRGGGLHDTGENQCVRELDVTDGSVDCEGVANSLLGAWLWENNVSEENSMTVKVKMSTHPGSPHEPDRVRASKQKGVPSSSFARNLGHFTKTVRTKLRNVLKSKVLPQQPDRFKRLSFKPHQREGLNLKLLQHSIQGRIPGEG